MRLINRVLATLLALAVIGISALIIIEVVNHWFNKTPAIVHWHTAYSWAGRTTWKQGSLRVACIALLVVGLLLLIAELRRPKVSRLRADPDQTDTTGIDTAYTRRGAATAIRAAVTDVDGVRTASVRIGRRKVIVKATTAARDQQTAAAFREPITAAAEKRLNSLKLKNMPSVKAHVEPRSS